MHTIVRHSWVKHLDFILADVVCINISFFVAYCLRFGELSNMYENRVYRSLAIVMMLLHFFIAFFTNIYSGILKRGYLTEMKNVFFHNLMLILFMLAYMFFAQVSGTYSRVVLIAFGIIDTVLMYAIHIIMKYIQRHSNKQEFLVQNLIIVTQADRAQKAIEKITSGPDKSYRVNGVVLIGGKNSYKVEPDALADGNGGKKAESDASAGGNGNAETEYDVPVLAESAGDAYEYACRNIVDAVYIDLSGENKEEIEEIAQEFLQMGITVNINMDIYVEGVNNTCFGHINSARVMTAFINSISPMEKFIKRALDIAAGIVGCIITGILCIFVAPAIKIADPKGPVFFCQQRVGKNGRTFKMYKFRSMYSDAEDRKKELMDENKMSGLMFKIDADPRIIGSGPDGTKKGFGHFIRSTSIDEFPNFWSILKGDMSLVGTRPPTMDEYEKYELHHKSRLAIKPGLTGMWQVSGRNNITDFEEIVKLDNEYIRNWSIGLDLRIIVKTFFSVLGRIGSV